jgi:hypothetical protein
MNRSKLDATPNFTAPFARGGTKRKEPTADEDDSGTIAGEVDATDFQSLSVGQPRSGANAPVYNSLPSAFEDVYANTQTETHRLLELQRTSEAKK